MYALVKMGYAGNNVVNAEKIIEGVIYASDDKKKVEAVRYEVQALIDSYVETMQSYDKNVTDDHEYLTLMKEKDEARKKWLETHALSSADWVWLERGGVLEILEPRNDIFRK